MADWLLKRLPGHWFRPSTAQLGMATTSPSRIALIHATRVAIEPVELAAKKLWPEADLVSILEEGLSIDRAASSVSAEELNTRIVDLARYAERLKPAGILYTCSAFGEGIEQAARTSSLPVLKPNEAMFDAALQYGNNIALIYTFPPSLTSMENEFREAAERIGSNATLIPVFADGALEALKSGDTQTHNELIAGVSAGVDADAIMLAQFSMSIAGDQVRAASNLPVLTSPESAIEKMKRCVHAT